MGQMRNLIGAEGAAATGVPGPTKHSRLEEGAIENQLPPALEQIEQANLARRSLELITLFDSHPRHPAAFGGQSVSSPCLSFFLHQHFLARSEPLFLRYYRRRLNSEIFLPVVLVFRFARCHLFLPRFPKRLT